MIVWTGKRAYDPFSNEYSTGYWFIDGLGYWYPVWDHTVEEETKK